MVSGGHRSHITMINGAQLYIPIVRSDNRPFKITSGDHDFDDTAKGQTDRVACGIAVTKAHIVDVSVDQANMLLHVIRGCTRLCLRNIDNKAKPPMHVLHIKARKCATKLCYCIYKDDPDITEGDLSRSTRNEHYPSKFDFTLRQTDSSSCVTYRKTFELLSTGSQRFCGITNQAKSANTSPGN